MSERGPDGRFLHGNAGGPGNPHARQTAELRSALLDAIDADAIRRVIAALLTAAEEGDVAAARVLLERVFGRPADTETVQRIERLEEAVEARQQERPDGIDMRAACEDPDMAATLATLAKQVADRSAA